MTDTNENDLDIDSKIKEIQDRIKKMTDERYASNKAALEQLVRNAGCPEKDVEPFLETLGHMVHALTVMIESNPDHNKRNFLSLAFMDEPKNKSWELTIRRHDDASTTPANRISDLERRIEILETEAVLYETLVEAARPAAKVLDNLSCGEGRDLQSALDAFDTISLLENTK